MTHHISLTSIDPHWEHLIEKKLGTHTVDLHESTIDKCVIDPNTTILGVFVDSIVDATIIKKLPNLTHIATFSTGYDHIDLKMAKKKRITVSNVPSYGENTVAEHTLALILSLSRKMYPSIKRVKEGVYDYKNLTGFDLKGRTVGVIGTGRIGQHVIQMLKGFEVNILAYDTYPNNALDVTYTTLESLLAQSDIITLHLPLMKSTKHVINMRTIKKIKPGAYLVNTARGGLIEAAALLWGLQSGIIAGAGIDVLEGELILKTPEKILSLKSEEDIRCSLIENAIIDHPHTIITPHNAFNSTEALERIVTTAIDNIVHAIDGKPTNTVKA